MTMATMAAGVLLGAETLCVRGFSVNGKSFSPVDLQRIGLNIFAGYNPTVKYITSLGNTSEYDSYNNTLRFGFNSVPSVMERSMVIHEATHAACDMNRQKMTVADSEIMAYIAQCQYARYNNPYPGSRYLKGNTWQSDDVYEIAWLLAGKILDGVTLSSWEISNLRDAIFANPVYGAKASGMAGYAGL